MKIKRCALAAAVVLAGCTVAFLCWNRSVPESGAVAENSVAPIQAAASAAPTTVAALAASVAEPASNQTATVRGTKPYVVTCGENFNNSNRLAVEALGVKTVEVLSRKALLVEADAATIARVRASGKFSVEREFLPSDKIAPALAAQIAGGAGDVDVSVVTLSPADHRRVQNRVVARGGEILTGCFNEGTTFRARMSAALVSELASFGDVRWMEVFVRPQIMNDVAVTNLAMNVQEARDVLGLTGSDQFVSTSDSGIDLTHLDLVNQVADHKIVKDCVEYDGIGHGTHTAGSIAGDGTMSDGQIRGTAYGAKLYAWFCGKEGDRGIYTPTTMAELFRGNTEGTEWDVYIHSASWGSDKGGEYDTECADIDKYVWEHPDFLPVFSAGNSGSNARTIGSPAAAKNVLAVGATQNLRKEGGGKLGNGDPTQTASYSSRGPCKDGRTKPDIAAPGTGVLSTRAYNQEYSYGVYEANTNYAYDTGTSMSCPLTAGAVALVREWLLKPERGFTEDEPPTAALMKAIVTGGAKDAVRPNNDQGWGRIDLMQTLAPSNNCAVKLIDRIPFADGEEFTWIVETTNDAPFDVQLAWIDYPGAASGSQSAPKIINDLDLTVRAVDGGDLLYGNGGSSADSLNTLESVRIESASANRYFVTVSCPYVFADYNQGGAAALYIRGAFDPETVEPYWTVRIVKSPSETNTYIRLDKALADAKSGNVIEILDKTELSASVTLTNNYALTIVATNANARLSPISRRNGADILVTKGSLFFSNVVFQTESTTPVRVDNDGAVKVAGTAVFDDIVSRTPGILTAKPEGFVLAGPLENGITVDCTKKSSVGDQFGVYSCADAVAAESASRLVSSYGVDRAGVAEVPGILKWGGKEVPVDPEVAVGYVDGTKKVYYRTLDQLFDEHPNGTNVVITKSGLRLVRPRTLSGKQSIVAEDGVGEIVVRPEGAAGFTVGAGCDLTVSGITFRDYMGNGLFVVNGAGANLTVIDSVFRNIEGTNRWSGAIAVQKGHVSSVNTDYDNCRATGNHYVQNASGESRLTNGNKSYGGAICLSGSGCSLELNGGRITGCSARTYGGGVYAAGGSSVSVRGALKVKGNKAGNYKATDDDIHLVNATTSILTLSGRLNGLDTVGVRYEQSADVPGFGNDAGNCLAVVKAGVDPDDALASTTAFFNDTEPETTRAEVNGDRLRWIERTPGDRQVEPGHPDATVRVTKGGETRWYIEPEYAFEWIDADATVEVLKNAEFGGDLVVTNGVKVTLRSADPECFNLRRQGETEIRVLPGASLTVTNVVLDGNGESSTIGLVKVEGEGASLELQADATVGNVIGSADRASGAISVQKGGTFTMRSGAWIVDCRNEYVNAGSKSGYGAGLLVEDHSTANLLGGSITGCRANRGGGVFIGTESTVNIAGDMTVSGNWNLDKIAKADNLCVADLSGLKLTGPLTGKIGYNEGRSGDINVFGKVASGFSGTQVEMQSSAHNFTHDSTGDVGMAVSDGSETLLVWGNALDADGKYAGTYALVNDGAPLYEIRVPTPSNFTYDGTEKICLEDGIGYRVLRGNVATNIGNYVVVVTTRAGFAWDDGTGQKNLPWKIEAAEYELKGVTFEDATFEYDGTMKYLALTGTLPAGFSVEYDNNGRWQPGTNEVRAVISGSVPNYKPNPFKTTLQAKLIIVDPEGRYHGETEPPGPLPTVTTNWPSAIAFASITRVADTNWILSVTNRVKWCRYRLIYTDDLVKGFTTTGDWEQATAEGLWTTNVIFSADEAKPTYFWRAEGTWGIVPEGE